MRQLAGLGLIAACLTFAAIGAAASSGRLTLAQQQRLGALVKQADKLDGGGDAVKAYLMLREASRLEQVWSSNTAGDETPTTDALQRFTLQLLRRNDGSLMKVLHSRVVPLGDKLSLMRMLEQEVIVNYPGVHAGDELLQGYDEAM